jgi:hypothetical protein
MSIDVPMVPETASEPPGTRSAEVRDTVRSAPSDTTVVITQAEVLFSTATATGLQRKDRGWVRALRAIFVVSLSDSRPKRRNPPPRMDFLEDSRMAREMLRL